MTALQLVIQDTQNRTQILTFADDFNQDFCFKNNLLESIISKKLFEKI